MIYAPRGGEIVENPRAQKGPECKPRLRTVSPRIFLHVDDDPGVW
jgi:hypothetical protein